MAEESREVVSVASLGTPDKDGWLTKQGGSFKSWKRRWFILKGDTLFYFKTQRDIEQKGHIKLDPNTTLEDEPNQKKKFFFAVATPSRRYLIYSDTEEQKQQWVERISKALAQVKSGGGAKGSTNDIKEDRPAVNNNSNNNNNSSNTSASSAASDNQSNSRGQTPRNQIAKAKSVIPFLQDEESKVLEFWLIWSESIPPREDLQPGLSIEFHVSTSANMQKLTWRTAGPQNIFIQKMVDFFWNVGAPESEIDRLNDVGALINPIKIGSWIDMSAKCGMDGGWYFPVEIPFKMAIEAADPGDPSRKVTEWADTHNVDKAWSVGRDMGAAPPRQTEIRVRLPGNDAASQLVVGLDAFDKFDFPPLPDNALSILKELKNSGMSLSVITSSDGFVRLGLMTPKPDSQAVQRLCSIVGANFDDLHEFQRAMKVDGPAYAEFQFLKEGFGYGVYKEGFDIVFHYDVGSEGPEE